MKFLGKTYRFSGAPTVWQATDQNPQIRKTFEPTQVIIDHRYSFEGGWVTIQVLPR